MIRIAIVEDDRHDREALKKCLNRYEKNQMKFSITEFQDGEDIVTDYTASYDTHVFWILRWLFSME